MRKIRVLVVDASVAMGRMLVEILSADNELEVIGSVSNATVAIESIRQSAPDIVVLDIKAPGACRLELLTEIHRFNSQLPIVVCSSLAEHTSALTLEILSRGATDYVTKPDTLGDREAVVECVHSKLLPKLKALGIHFIRLSGGLTSASPVLFRQPPPPVSPILNRQVEVVAVGSSTGGPKALSELFQNLPKGVHVPFLIVQHMPPLFTRLLSERLSAISCLPFHEAQDGDLIEPGHAWIAPGDYHMRVVCDGRHLRLHLDQAPPEHSCRPAVDVLFRSVAEVYGEHTLAVILTGMGRDGLHGCQVIRERGGQVLAQDKATSVVWGMPGLVVNAGLADAALPLNQLHDEIERRVCRRGYDVADASGLNRVEGCHVS